MMYFNGHGQTPSCARDGPTDKDGSAVHNGALTTRRVDLYSRFGLSVAACRNEFRMDQLLQIYKMSRKSFYGKAREKNLTATNKEQLAKNESVLELSRAELAAMTDAR
jgi:hypothetical protein